MIRNLTYMLMGILAGLSFLSYGLTMQGDKKPVVVQVPKPTTVESLKENVIIDPVEITSPEVENREVAAQLEQSETELQEITEEQMLLAANNEKKEESATADKTSILQEVEQKKNEEVIQDGWANAGFIPQEEEEYTDELDDSDLQEEVVE